MSQPLESIPLGQEMSVKGLQLDMAGKPGQAGAWGAARAAVASERTAASMVWLTGAGPLSAFYKEHTSVSCRLELTMEN